MGRKTACELVLSKGSELRGMAWGITKKLTIQTREWVRHGRGNFQNAFVKQ